MNKPMTLPRLLCLTTALAAGPALMTTGVANARVYHQHGTSHVQLRHSQPANYAKRYGLSSRFVIGGQSANVKRALNQQNAPHEARCQTHCYQTAQTAPKGNPTLSTTAAKTAPTAHPIYAYNKRVEDAVLNVGAAAATASIVPPAASLGTAIIGNPGMGIVGTIKHGNPITGPAQESIDFAKEYTSVVETVIGGLWCCGLF